MISLISLIISLSLIMYLAYKGYSTIITAPIIGLLTILISNGLNAHLMANYTEVYMNGFSGFVKSYFPLFLTGAIFAKLMDEAGYGKSIASFITNKLGKDKAILAIVLKEYRGDYALVLVLAGGVTVTCFLLKSIVTPIGYLKQLFNDNGIKMQYFSVALKALGIGYITGFIADACRDGGQASLAGKAELAGKCAVFILVLPLIASILETALGFLK